MRWIAVVSVMLVALGTACTKDNAKKKTAEDKTEAPAAAAPSTGDKAANPLPTSAKTEKLASPTASSTRSTAKAGEGTNGPAWGLSFADEAIAVAGVRSFDQLYTLAQAKLKKYGLDLPIMSKEAVLAQGQQLLGLSTMDWLDRSRPIKAVLWNPKKHSEALVLLPVTGPDALTKALPTTREANVQGNAFSINVAGVPVYLNPVDGHVAASADAQLFPNKKAFVSEVAKGFTPSGLVDVRVSTTNVKRAYSTELALGMTMLPALKAQFPTSPDMSEAERKDLEGMLDMGLGVAKIIVKEAEGLRLTVDLTDGGMLDVALALQAQSGGEVARVASALSSSDLSELKKAPKDTWIAGGTYFGDLSKEYTTAMNAMSFTAQMGPAAELLQLNEADKAKLKELTDKLQTLTHGFSGGFVYADGQFPVGLLMSTGVSDGTKAKTMFTELLAFLYEKGFDRLREFLPPALQTLPSDDFPQFVKAIGAIVAPMGVQLSASEKTEEDVTSYSLSLQLDAAKASAFDDENGKNITQLLKAVGNSLEISIAFGPKDFAISVGPTATKKAREFVSANASSNNADMTRLLSELPKRSGFVTQIDLGKGFELFKPLVAIFKPEDVEKMSLFSAGSTIRVTVSGQDRECAFGLQLPLDQLVMLGFKNEKESAAQAPSREAPSSASSSAR